MNRLGPVGLSLERARDGPSAGADSPTCRATNKALTGMPDSRAGGNLIGGEKFPPVEGIFPCGVAGLHEFQELPASEVETA